MITIALNIAGELLNFLSVFHASFCQEFNDDCALVDDTDLASPSAVSIINCMAVWEILSGAILDDTFSINIVAVCVSAAEDFVGEHDRSVGRFVGLVDKNQYSD